MKETFFAEKNAMLSGILSLRYPWLNKSKIQRLITGKNVKLDGARVSADAKVAKNAELEVFLPATFEAEKIEVVYLDENVVIADKPAHTDSVTALPKMLEKEYGTLYPVHRLDTNTTGIVVLARGHKTRVELELAFKRREVHKKYIATVVGTPKKSKGVMSGWLIKDSASGIVRVSNVRLAGGLEAVTEYEVISSEDGLSEVELLPLTGRTHQLRAQLAHLGCPILGDGKYGDFDENKRRGVNVQQLRAVSIKFNNVGGIVNYLKGREFEVKR